VIAWEGDQRPGLWREYEGGITDWQLQRQRTLASAMPEPRAEGARPVPATVVATRAKLSNREKRELDELPARIEALEAEQRGIGERLAGAELYTQEPQRVAELQARYAQIDDELNAALERWEELGSR
jgi:ATP-binding cassette subfamily F protein uup